MSCLPCDQMQDKGDVAYVRIGKANVGLTGCDEHVGEVLQALAAIRQMVDAGEIEMVPWDRPVVRVKNQHG